MSNAKYTNGGEHGQNTKVGPARHEKAAGCSEEDRQKACYRKKSRLETVSGVMQELATLGRKASATFSAKRRARSFFGVRIGDMKPIVKGLRRTKLALELYDTGNYDAMYLAGLIADDTQMTRKDLAKWAKQAQQATADQPSLGPAGSPVGMEMARVWMRARTRNFRNWWSTWCSFWRNHP